MSDLVAYLGGGLAIVGGFLVTAACVYGIDCLTRPLEQRRQLELAADRAASAKLRARVVQRLFTKQTYFGKVSTVTTDDGTGEPGQAEPCPICIEPFVASDEVTSGLECGHLYHRTCLLEWLDRKEHEDCPVCRKPMWTTHAFNEAKRQILREDPEAVAEELEQSCQDTDQFEAGEEQQSDVPSSDEVQTQTEGSIVVTPVRETDF